MIVTDKCLCYIDMEFVYMYILTLTVYGYCCIFQNSFTNCKHSVKYKKFYSNFLMGWVYHINCTIVDRDRR